MTGESTCNSNGGAIGVLAHGNVALNGLDAGSGAVNITATLWAAGVAMRLRSMQAGPMMQVPVFLILFFAPVYVPLALLQGQPRQPPPGPSSGV